MKILRGERELSANDVEEIPKGLIPGEWVWFADAQSKKKYAGYVNSHAEIFFKIKLLKTFDITYSSNLDEKQFAETIILDQLTNAIKKREMFVDYQNGCRLVYGINDSLPGLIVDKYQKYILVQINTAGLDRFRELIGKIIASKFPDQKVVFYDNEEYRKAEVLPTHDKESIDDDLSVVENNLHYRIPKEVMQKIGYYYDHRENRQSLKTLLQRLNVKKQAGLDLFSYVGSWGLHMLSAGVEHVEFVDQGQMLSAIETNLELNKFTGRGSFTRGDVFKYLDTAHASGKTFDVIVSDPPAFTKSEKNKINAIQGYEKLHTKAMKLLNDQAIFVAASCTHYVDYEELDKTVQDAAFKHGMKVQLMDLGAQGFDHPMSGLKDKSFYIKYLAYFVTRG